MRYPTNQLKSRNEISASRSAIFGAALSFGLYFATSSTAAPTSAPSAAAGTRPTSSTTAGAPSAKPAARVASAQLLFRKFDSELFDESQKSGRATLLVFAEASSDLWTKQGPVLQGLLRDGEKVDVDVFQIDMKDAPTANRFRVFDAGTMLVMKSGVERMRSAGMTKPTAIRNFVRLIPTL